MSLENIPGFVRGLLQKDDSLSDPNNCRDSVLKIKAEIDKRFPTAEVEFLAYPEARLGDSVHYSVLAIFNGRKILINTVKSPGFPIYIGDWENAVPTFFAMKKSDKVV